MKKVTLLLFGIMLVCCASKNKISTAQIDFSKYDINNKLSNFEIEHATATCYITTTPAGADVFMDGKYIGQANKDVVLLPPGKHEITLIKEHKFYQTTLYFQEGSNRPLDIQLKD